MPNKQNLSHTILRNNYEMILRNGYKPEVKEKSLIIKVDAMYYFYDTETQINQDFELLTELLK